MSLTWIFKKEIQRYSAFNFSGDILITKELDYEEQNQFVFNLTASDEFYVRTTLLIGYYMYTYNYDFT